MEREKQIGWVGSAYDDLLAFPKDARKEAGFQLGKVQAGLEPSDWKPFDAVGAGTRELRISEASGIYRVMYVASKKDQNIAAACYRAVARRERKLNEDRH